MRKKTTLLLFLMVSCISLCYSQSKQDADLFYIISTEVLHAYDQVGGEIYNSQLCAADTLNMYAEKKFVQDNYAGDLRFFAPYYEQFTFQAINEPADVFAEAYEHAKQDLFRRFQQYIAEDNHGRPFVLMGFSQGAMLALDLLKEMPDELYERCKAVYMLGYRLSADDVQHPRVQPATDATHGNVIAFNSVTRKEAAMPLVSEGSVTCINPLNWHTDATPATLYFDGDTAIVSVDQESQLLLVSNIDEAKYQFPLFEPGCLHHWDLLFYTQAIRENIKLRTQSSTKTSIK